jgi:hypothetical protein
MRELSNVAETLRTVQKARRRFLELWQLEKDCIEPMLDRMAEDLQGISFPHAIADDDPSAGAGDDATGDTI